ncbi:hypothetical protein QZH41_004644 [Actinostola sp. cb2023]|nr:hypothetical protein QZH41_004644 [Actinostola sp. cb2023]
MECSLAGTDPLFEVLVKAKQGQQGRIEDMLIREIPLFPEPVIFLATEQQLVGVERFCTNPERFCVLGVDATLEIAGFYYTFTTYRNLMLETQRGNHPVCIGPGILHKQKLKTSFKTLPLLMTKYRNETGGVLAFGSDGEENLINAFSEVFETAKHLRCFSQIFSEGTFMEVSQRRSSKQRQRAPPQPPTDSDSDSDASESGLDRLFQCPNEGCIKVYQRHSGLENHLSYGKCELQEERHTLLDKAKSLYHQKLMEGATAGASLPPNTVDAQASYDVQPTQGWALKFTRKARRFNDSQKKYLDEKFGIGQQTRHKLDPANVARDMRFAKGTSGAKLF